MVKILTSEDKRIAGILHAFTSHSAHLVWLLMTAKGEKDKLTEIYAHYQWVTTWLIIIMTCAAGVALAKWLDTSSGVWAAAAVQSSLAQSHILMGSQSSQWLSACWTWAPPAVRLKKHRATIDLFYIKQCCKDKRRIQKQRGDVFIWAARVISQLQRWVCFKEERREMESRHTLSSADGY